MYRNIQEIGKGTYGTVYRAEMESDGTIVAIKKVKLDNPDEGVPCTTLREIAILRATRHPNIVEVKDVISTKKAIHIVFEYFPFDLHKYMKHVKFLPYSLVCSYTRQLLSAVDHIHALGFIHRDIKPQNILVSQNNLKLCDFGLARSSTLPVSSLSSDVITRWYRPPELLKEAKEYGTEIDIWSVGCVVGEMLAGAPLFPSASVQEHLQLILEYSREGEEWLKRKVGHVERGMLELLGRLLDPDPTTRITAADALKNRSVACTR